MMDEEQQMEEFSQRMANERAQRVAEYASSLHVKAAGVSLPDGCDSAEIYLRMVWDDGCTAELEGIKFIAGEANMFDDSRYESAAEIARTLLRVVFWAMVFAAIFSAVIVNPPLSFASVVLAVLALGGDFILDFIKSK